ncbi:bulb-type lectin domain-containing protein [Xylariaceae sp. FL0594]|nr:bulb-type lectin domain-containing protein [Xylariaceae sp. FL0594]
MSKHSTLGNGEWLLTGQSLFSADGSVELRMQDDGKIALYYGGECRWQNTPDQRYDIKGLIMQGDGNLCIYDKAGKATWHTNTASPTGNSTCTLVVQNDGNLVVYKGTPIWASKSNK